jgi:hypothetical protein
MRIAERAEERVRKAIAEAANVVLTLAIEPEEDRRERAETSNHRERHGGKPCDSDENACLPPFAKVKGVSRRVTVIMDDEPQSRVT